MGQNSKTQNVSKLITLIVTKLKKWQNSRTQNVTKLKNSKCDNAQKLKMRPNSKTQKFNKTKKKYIYNKTKELKLWQNVLAKIVTKLRNWNCDKTHKLKFSKKKLK